MIRSKWKFAIVTCALAGAATTIALKAGSTLVIDGKSSTVDIKMVNGSAYVRLADVARSFDRIVVKRGEGKYELTKPGGANQIGGLTGKIGDTLFDGKWRFTVLSVDTVDSYTMKTDSEPYGARMPYEWNRTTKLLKPTEGHVLVIIQCKVSNGVKERRTLWTAISDDRIRTSITDSDANASPPVAYDYDGAPIQTAYLLPGSQLTFPVIFSVNKSATLKDLVFTLKNNQGDEKGVDVRVSLSK